MSRVQMSIAAIALLSVLGITQSAAAHVTNIASFHLMPGDDAWRLEVNMSTAGMHQALQALHPDEGLSALTPEAYEALLVGALRDGINLRVDGVALVLDHPIVEVRSHASRVVFVMASPHAGAPTGVHRIEAHIDALSARGDQNNVFRFLGERISRVVLKSDNDFRGHIDVALPTESTITAAAPGARRLWIPAGLLLLGLFLIGSGLRTIRSSARQRVSTL